MPDRRKKRLSYLISFLAFCGILVAIIVFRQEASSPISINAPETAEVFGKWEAAITFSNALSGLATLSNTQVNDAYDADRNGTYIRIYGVFTHASGRLMKVPGFAMKERPDGEWVHKIRWSPDRAGVWSFRVTVDGGIGGRKLSFSHQHMQKVEANAVSGIKGSLVPPSGNDNPIYVREKMSDGTTDPTLLYGMCRAWTVRYPSKDSVWGEDELIDRQRELFSPMRAHGLNMLNQWMAPWEYLLVHHSRNEHWENPDHTFRKIPVPDDQEWSSHQCYDQGRAAAFDTLMGLCEGDRETPTIRILIAPLPHPLFRQADHPWSEGESFWSPWENPDRSPSAMNGFCLNKEMVVWDFFDADPRLPLTDPRSKLFDHQANFFRYLIARWGYSRALGAWTILDELEGIGDEEGYFPERTGFWGHPQCERWLNDMVRLFNGNLQRAEDEMEYGGDPYDHPTHVATSSVRGEYGRGTNLDWTGSDFDARADIHGWHWYPPLLPPISNWWKAWNKTLAGVTSFSDAPIGNRPRLISEFGAIDRVSPEVMPSSLYPSMYHFSSWAAVMGGQAGTVMEWNDGKGFGEFFPKQTGGFSRSSYPISMSDSLSPLKRFVSHMPLEELIPLTRPGVAVELSLSPSGIATALTTAESDALYGWLFSPDTRVDTSLEIRGLMADTYVLTFYDSWTGGIVHRQTLVAESVESRIVVNIQPVLYSLEQSDNFPYTTRQYRGHDLALTILPGALTGDAGHNGSK